MKKNKNALVWLWEISKPIHTKMLGLAVGDVVLSVIAVSYALACRNLIDYAVASHAQGAVWWAGYLCLVAVLQFFLQILLNDQEESIRASMGQLLRNLQLEELLKKEYGAVREVHSGEWMNRFFSDVQIVSDGVATILPNVCSTLTRLGGAIAVLVIMEPLFVAVFLTAGLFIGLLAGFFRKRMKRLHKDVQEKQGRVQAFLQEVLDNFLIIRIFCHERGTQQKCASLQEEHVQAQMHRRRLSIAANAGLSLLMRMGYLFALCWGAGGLYLGTMSYGTLTAVLQLVGQIQGPLANLSGILPRYYTMTASAERIRDLYALPDEPQALPHCVENFQQISFEHVAFSYGRAPVLKDVSFQINAGDMVALTGLSGGGKSTIFLLLLGIYPAQNGLIQLQADGETLAPGKLARGLFTYVPQDLGLFSGTILENLRIANQTATQEDIDTALRVACADAFIHQLPNGLHTPIGEHGHSLSEGQCQRIAIARAVLSKAPVLLLDEATSALDLETEAAVLKNISALKDRTCLIVTHRQAALGICNKRLLLKDGFVRSSLRERTGDHGESSHTADSCGRHNFIDGSFRVGAGRSAPARSASSPAHGEVEAGSRPL